MATFVYHILTGSFNLELYVTQVIRFNASGPLYYVLMYLELLFVVPILVLFLKYSGWRGICLEIIGLLACMAIAYFTTNYTNVLSIFGGGGKILGGTFLILLYVGVWFGKYCRNIRLGIFPTCVVSLTFIIMTVAYWYFVVSQQNKSLIDSCFPYNVTFNPPGISLIVYGCLTAGTIYCCGTLLDRCMTDEVPWLLRGVTYLGRHTLYVFLYHSFWIDILSKFSCVQEMGFTLSKWAIYFFVMILGSLLFEFIMKLLKRAIVAAYRLSGDERGQ